MQQSNINWIHQVSLISFLKLIAQQVYMALYSIWSYSFSNLTSHFRNINWSPEVIYYIRESLLELLLSSNVSTFRLLSSALSIIEPPNSQWKNQMMSYLWQELSNSIINPRSCPHPQQQPCHRKNPIKRCGKSYSAMRWGARGIEVSIMVMMKARKKLCNKHLMMVTRKLLNRTLFYQHLKV